MQHTARILREGKTLFESAVVSIENCDIPNGFQGFGGSVVPDLTFGPSVRSGPHNYRTVEIHVNDDHACPPKATPGEQGSCWLILNDFQPALHT